MSKFLKDYHYGINKEIQLLPQLQSFLNDNTIYKLENSNVFDFKGDNKFIELKSRNNNYSKYPTTMIGLNKIKKASTLQEYVYFFFCFNDGLYYWLYDKDCELEIKRAGRFDRGRPEINEYCFIPIELLQKVI
jgi:hypothetical protein